MKFPINLNSLLHVDTIERDRVEYKAGWDPKAALHCICVIANDVPNMSGNEVDFEISLNRATVGS